MVAANRMPSFLATMVWEGGDKLSRDKADPGNWTGGKVGVGVLAGSQWGVSAPVARAHGWTPGRITKDQALGLFLDKYWITIGADSLPAGLDHEASDDSYNAGPGRAKQRLASVQAFALSSAVAPRIHAYSKLRLTFLEGLRNWAADGPGWARRVAGVEAESLKMAIAAQAQAAVKISAPPGLNGFLTPPDVPAPRRETIDHQTIAAAAAAAHDDHRAAAFGAGALAAFGGFAAALGPGVSKYALMTMVVAVVVGILHQLWHWHAHGARRDALDMLANELKPDRT